MSENVGEYTLSDGTDIRALPKVSLHDHLDGGLRPATVLELADGIGLDLPFVQLAYRLFQDAAAGGLGALDHSALYRHLKAMNKL